MHALGPGQPFMSGYNQSASQCLKRVLGLAIDRSGGVFDPRMPCTWLSMNEVSLDVLLLVACL